MPFDNRSVIWRKGRSHADALRKLAAELKLRVIDEIVVAQSGLDGDDRHTLSGLLAKARAREMGSVVVWSMTDIEPRGVRELLMLLGELTRCGIAVHSVTEPWVAEACYCEALIAGVILLLSFEEEARRHKRWHSVDRTFLTIDQVKGGI